MLLTIYSVLVFFIDYDMNCFLFRVSPSSMGDDGTMSKGAGYTPEFRTKAVGLLTESRGSYSSETKAVE